MTLKSIILIKFGSIRNCAIKCDIPYATAYKICEEELSLYHCECRTALKLAKGLGMTLDELLEGETFQEFRNDLHNQKKALGDKRFLLRHLQKNTVDRLWEDGSRDKALYLLAMLDVLCKKNKYPMVQEYQDKRMYRLEKAVYIGDSILDKEKARAKAIPEFAMFNIYEGTLDDAI